MKKSILFAALSILLSHTAFAAIEDGKSDLKKIYGYVLIYKRIHNGSSPSSMSELRSDMLKNLEIYGYKNSSEFFLDLKNKDVSLNPRYSSPRFARFIPYVVVNRRVDGSSVDDPVRSGERDLLSFSDVYLSSITSLSGKIRTTSEWGDWIVLWYNGEVESVPFDTRYFVGNFKDGFRKAFMGQASISFDTLSYSEYNTFISNNSTPKPTIKGTETLVVDNGGPESIVQLSRRAGFPNIYGIDRTDLWKTFDISQPEFTLMDLQIGAARLGFDTRVQKLALSQLQQGGSSALLFLKDDGRIVTLSSMSNDHAVVVDRGVTHIVERSVLEKRYSGEALIPAKTLIQNAGIVADDAVRALQLPSLEAEVPQQFTLRNTGKTPLTLQLEYPLLGVTESKLSKGTLAPGETATLDLKVKWRSVLKAPYQNVLVSLQTSDPIVPRLQLAILLNPPQTAAK